VLYVLSQTCNMIKPQLSLSTGMSGFQGPPHAPHDSIGRRVNEGGGVTSAQKRHLEHIFRSGTGEMV